jgi:hypothetical protein
MVMPTHTCRAPDCPRQIPTRYLMCATHWRLVPSDIAHRVNVAWWRSNNCRDRSACRVALSRYRAAVDEAIASLGTQPSSPEATTS